MVSSVKTVAKSNTPLSLCRPLIVLSLCPLSYRPSLYTAVVVRCHCPSRRRRQRAGLMRKKAGSRRKPSRSVRWRTEPLEGREIIGSDPAPVLLGLASFDGKLKFLSPAWEKILGYPAQELLDRPLRELMQQHGQAAVALVERLLAEDGLEPLEFGLRCQDGTFRWFLWHRRFDSEHQAIFIAGYDITEQKTRKIASLTQFFERPKRADAAI